MDATAEANIALMREAYDRYNDGDAEFLEERGRRALAAADVAGKADDECDGLAAAQSALDAPENSGGSSASAFTNCCGVPRISTTDLSPGASRTWIRADFTPFLSSAFR